MRLDEYLVRHKKIRSRSKAKDLIGRGLVTVDGKTAVKAGANVTSEHIDIDDANEFVSRSGQKLLHVLLDHDIDLTDHVVIDVGSSTGGFTDCALKHKAKRVYAYDVGKNQMDSTLKTNPKVVLNEETNIMDVDLPDADTILIDVSFTSVKPILGHIRNHRARVILLVKPQFEAGRIKFKGGVLRDCKVHKRILGDICRFSESLGYGIAVMDKAYIKGKSGNQEYVLVLDKRLVNARFDIEKRIGEVVC